MYGEKVIMTIINRFTAFILIPLVIGTYGCGNKIDEAESPPRSQTDESCDQRAMSVDCVLDQAEELRPGSNVSRTMRRGERHRYWVDLHQGEMFQCSVIQDGIDVVVSIFDPGGAELFEIDTPIGPFGREEVDVLADTSGRHLMEVAPWTGATSGEYQVVVDAIRPSSASDQEWVRALRSYCAAKKLNPAKNEGSAAQARELYKDAARIWEDLGDHYRAASALTNLGRARMAIGDWEGAIEAYEHAQVAAARSGEGGREAVVLNALGLAMRRTGRNDRAVACYLRSIQLARPSENRAAEAEANAKLGRIFLSQGDIVRAQELFSQALDVQQSIGEQTAVVETMYQQGLALLFLDRLAEARDLFNRLLQISLENGDSTHEAWARTELGWIEYRLGRYDEALDQLESALELITVGGAREYRASVMDRIGSVYRELGRYREAFASYENAVEILTELNNPVWIAAVQVNIGETHLRQGNHEEAISVCRTALPVLEEHREVHGAAHALTLVGRAQAALDRLDEARASLGRAVSHLEDARRRAGSANLRARFSAARYDAYEELIEVLIRLHREHPGFGHDAEALQVAENGRARSLLETLGEVAGREQVQLQADLDRKRVRIAADIEAKEAERLTLVARHASDDLVSRANAQMRELLLALEVEEQRSERLTRSSAAMNEPVLIAWAQEALIDEETQVLYFALGANVSFLWLIDRDSIMCYTLPSRNELETLATHSFRLLSESHLTGARGQAWMAAAAVSEALLGPVADRLTGTRLVVVGDGALDTLPFSALPLPSNQRPGSLSPPENGWPSLVDEFEIVHIPSISVVAAIRENRRSRERSPKLLSIFFDPVFTAADPRIGECPDGAQSTDQADMHSNAIAQQHLYRYKRLIHSKSEAESILELINGEAHMERSAFEATREAVFGGELENYRIIHFATHGLLHETYPDLSGIFLSMIDCHGVPRDGFLRAHEIRHLGLRAELVVLSACRTAAGPTLRGEGVMSLTRSFMEGGADRVIVSLWDVDDNAAATLMARLYQGMIKEGMRPSAALRAAQLELKKESYHVPPYYWAGFVFWGNWASFAE